MANQPHSPVPALQRQVKLDAVTKPAPYSQSFDNAALNPTALGAFGADIAMKASTELSRQRGYEDGLNPKGTLLPPLTNADKAYADAYIAQSQNTLGLQATRLMQEGQAELAKAYQLTPEMLQTYTKNMSEGLNEIIDNAPSQVQPGLAAQFSNSLMQSTGSLNQKMIAQQKQQALQEAAAFNTSQLASMYEAARGGDIKSAEAIHNDMVRRTNAMSNAGMISPTQAQTAAKSARISLYTGMYTGEAIKAFNEKKVDQYLADLLQKKPEGMNTLEWEAIAKSVMGEISLYESFQQRNETSLYSEANRLLNEDGLTPEFINQLEAETTSKPRFNNFMAQVASYQRKNASSNEKVSMLMPQWNSTFAMAVADSKTKNIALAQAGNDNQKRAAENGRQIDEFEGQMYAMATAGGPIQNFTQKLNAGLQSGNPELMTRSLNAYRYLQNVNPRVLSGVSKNAEAMMTNFESQMENGNAPDVAAQNALQVVMQKDKEQTEINARLFSEWENSKVNTQSRLNSWASNLADFGKSAPINNLPYFATHVKNIFRTNMNLLNGDVEGATKMTQDGIARAWGVTEINGTREAVFQPVEQTIGLDEGALPLIRNDIYEQVKAQIEPMKIAFEEGQRKNDNRVSFYYRLAERPSWEQFHAAQKTLRDIASKPPNTALRPASPLVPAQANLPDNPEWENAIKVINEFNKNTIGIEKVFSDKRTESFEISIQANPGIQQAEDGRIGSYNVSIRSNNGPNAPMIGIFSGSFSEPVYIPNESIIRQRYIDLVGLNPTGMSAFELNERRISRNKFNKEFGLDNPYQRLRGVF